MVADAFDEFCLSLGLVLPVVDVVDRVTLLKSFKHGLVLLGYSLRLLVALGLVQRFNDLIFDARCF